MTAVSRLFCALLIAGLFSGCTVTQDYQAPDISVPDGWRTSLEDLSGSDEIYQYENFLVMASSHFADTAWWEQFEDPNLDELIHSALKENMDLKTAVARVEEFSARVQHAKSLYSPQLNYGSGASYTQISTEKANTYSFTDRNYGSYSLSAGVNWELDLWGKIARMNEAARAELLSVEEAKRAVILTLVSELAEAYIELLALDSQLEITKRTLATRKEWLDLYMKKSNGGLISDLELIQAKSAYEEVAFKIPSLESRIAQQENYISILIGKNPGPIERKKTLESLLKPAIPQGLPSELLKRRPDILMAEQELIAMNAHVGVAQTQYYPSISLTGLLGYASSELQNLLTGSANKWAYGAELAGPLFTGGRLEAQSLQAQAQYQQVLSQYIKVIQNAFMEVNNALVDLNKTNRQIESERTYLAILGDYNHYAQKRYDSGYTPYITVLDSQRQLYRAEMSFVSTQAKVLKSVIYLYKVMGGGWVEVAAQEMKNAIVVDPEEYPINSK